ncbi:hypothetical protein [Streptomyces lavendulae]|nr:hypothetical protein [Streptomyces lavendulae]GLX18830.1 hypothetical protein Slala01_24740 [Streptomyces lavendulae subsp. lavendulae]GLX29248.1 hypothetical protein Slala02_50680 [Streptomyces lavendulae subsp. lavendulae]
MADHVPINPCTIPQFTGDLDALEQDHAAITAAAGTFRTAGENVDSEFQGLSAFYAAPEAAKLFATTKPVKTDSDFFADQLESAAKALGEYVTEARPIVARLKALQAKATTFTNKIAGDEHWKDDGKKIDENNDLIHDVNAAAEAFWAAERTCANKIRALYCAPPLTVNDGSNGANMYGYKADDLNKVQDLPWGSQLEETHRAWEVGYWVKSFVWDGIIVDGIWGTIRGLGTLVGVDGWDAAGQAWTGLAKLATGLAITTIPGVGTAFWMADDKQLPGWLRDSRTAMKETGKALVAWDEWGKNPARAAGAVTFNVLTTVFTGGAGTAAKTGGIAKVLSVAGKAGKIIDPITYIGKAGSLAKLKIGDLFANLGKVDGAFPKIDDVVWKDLPKADAPGVKFPHPDDTVQLLDDALGRPQYFDKVTNQLLDHKGLPKQDLTSVPKGPDHPLAEVPKRQEVPVGVGAHTADVTSHTPGGATTHTPGGTASHTPGGTADNMPHNNHTEPGGNTGTGGHGNTDTTPTTDGVPHQGSGIPDNLGHDPSPGGAGHGGDHGPGNGGGGSHGTGGDGPTTPGHGERPPLPPHRDNPHDYTTAERKQIMEYQVHRANDPTDGYRKQYYNKLGHRLRVVGDHTGLVPPQLVEVSPGKWVPKSELPPPVPPNYLDDAKPVAHDDPTVTKEMTEKLDKAAKERWDAMEADKKPHTDYRDAKAAHKAAPTEETLAAMEKARADHKPFHEALSKKSEAFGETIAREHAIPKEFPGAKEEKVYGPANGNDQFDQVYKHGDRYVVVEAKGNVNTELGERRIGADRVSQGTRAYFQDILKQMEKRAETDPLEKALFDKLDAAFDAGKIDYVVVKGADNAGTYTGHTIQRFDISK